MVQTDLLGLVMSLEPGELERVGGCVVLGCVSPRGGRCRSYSSRPQPRVDRSEQVGMTTTGEQAALNAGASAEECAEIVAVHRAAATAASGSLAAVSPNHVLSGYADLRGLGVSHAECVQVAGALIDMMGYRGLFVRGYDHASILDVSGRYGAWTYLKVVSQGATAADIGRLAAAGVNLREYGYTLEVNPDGTHNLVMEAFDGGLPASRIDRFVDALWAARQTRMPGDPVLVHVPTVVFELIAGS